MNKVEMIEKSLACATYGYLSFVLGVGIIFSLLAIRLYSQVLFSTEVWNPAKGCLLRGGGAAVLGLLLHAVGMVLIFKI